MTVVLEVTGGFTGPAGKERVEVDVDTLPPDRAVRLRADLEQIPTSAWGGSFLLPHPKPWDFRQVLSLVTDEGVRSIVFHRGAGPAALTAISKALLDER